MEVHERDEENSNFKKVRERMNRKDAKVVNRMFDKISNCVLIGSIKGKVSSERLPVMQENKHPKYGLQ